MNVIYKYRHIFIYLPLFILLSLAVFFPTLYGTALWDDWAFIFRNAFLHKATSPLAFFNGEESRAWPVFHAFIWGLFKLFDYHYLYYHLVSIFMHGLNSYLCYLILKKFQIRNYLLLSILFLAHPLQLLTVAWIIQLKTLLSIFFLFLTLLSLLKYFERHKILFYFLSILFFAASTFSKSTTAIVSLCFLITYPLLRKNISQWKFLLLNIPFLTISLLSIFKTAWHPQYQTLLLISALIIPTAFFIYKFRHFLRDNLFYILPLATSLSFVWFFYRLPNRIIPISIATLFFLIFVIFQKIAKRYWPLSLLICFSFLVYCLYLDVYFAHYIKFIPFDDIVLTLKNFIRYFKFIALPFNNLLFSPSTEVNFSSLEFLQLFILFSLFYYFCRYLREMKLYSLQVGLVFYSLTILPLCGFITLPIFSYTNFSPYWLSIPFIGLLPLYSHFIKSQKILAGLTIALLLTTHIQSYRFIQTENIFLDSIKQTPDLPILKVSLIEHYVFVGRCKEARSLLKLMNNQEILIEFSTEKKVNNCKESI